MRISIALKKAGIKLLTTANCNKTQYGQDIFKDRVENEKRGGDPRIREQNIGSSMG